MSMSRSISVGSSVSTATMTTLSPDDLVADSSNGLYENREHFQAIFTNDSRFFDTSLHLFKSYYALGYIQMEDEQSSNHLHVPSRLTSHGHKHRWRTRLLGSHHHNDSNNNGTLKSFLTPILLRKNDQINRTRYETSNSNKDINTPYKKNSLVVHYQQASVPTISISDDTKYDESEVTITRL